MGNFPETHFCIFCIFFIYFFIFLQKDNNQGLPTCKLNLHSSQLACSVGKNKTTQVKYKYLKILLKICTSLLPTSAVNQRGERDSSALPRKLLQGSLTSLLSELLPAELDGRLKKWVENGITSYGIMYHLKKAWIPSKNILINVI